MLLYPKATFSFFQTKKKIKGENGTFFFLYFSYGEKTFYYDPHHHQHPWPYKGWKEKIDTNFGANFRHENDTFVENFINTSCFHIN